MDRIIGIDYGRKRIGIAVSDPLRIFASPLETVQSAKIIEYLKSYSAGERIVRFVVGYPINMNGKPSEAAADVDIFLKEHAASAEFANAEPDAASELIAAAGIIEKAPVAKKALPYCNITCLTGEDMKTALSGYLKVLFEQDPKAVGGTLPEDTFYYVP